MKRFIFLSFLMSAIISAGWNSIVTRSNYGLYGGHVEYLVAYDMPGTPNRIYADLRGPNSIYFTDDAGVTWTSSLSGEDVFGLAVDANFVYAIVNGEEIWATSGTDGLTWTKILDSTTSVYTGEHLFSIQHDGTRLMVGAEGGVAYFNPTGNPADWTRQVIRLASPDIGVVCLASRPSDPNTILAVLNSHRQPLAANNEIRESTDAGATWHNILIPATVTTAVEVIAEDPSRTGVVYIGGDSANATVYQNTTYLDPAGWVDITPPTFQHRYPQQFDFHSGLLWTTAHTYNYSSGVWTQLPNTTIGTHVNDGTIAFDPDDPLLIMLPSDVGAAVTTVGGATFEERNNGLEAVEVFDIDVDTIDKNTALVATKSGIAFTSVFQKPPTPADWTFPVFPQGNGGPPQTAVAILQGTTQEFLVGDNSETIFLSEDGGSTWRDTYRWLASPITNRSSVNDIDHAVGTNTVYACIGFWEMGTDGVVVRSDSRGKAWIETALTGVHPNAIEVVGTNLIYAGVGDERDFPSTTNIGIYASNDGGATWSQVTWMGSALPYIVTDIAQDPVNPAIQYVCGWDGFGGGGVFQIEYDSTGLTVVNAVDLGMTYSGPMGGRFTAIETDSTGGRVFVGVNSEVAVFDVTAKTWALYYSGVRGETIYSLYWDALVGGISTGFYAFNEEIETAVKKWSLFE